MEINVRSLLQFKIQQYYLYAVCVKQIVQRMFGLSFCTFLFKTIVLQFLFKTIVLQCRLDLVELLQRRINLKNVFFLTILFQPLLFFATSSALLQSIDRQGFDSISQIVVKILKHPLKVARQFPTSFAVLRFGNYGLIRHLAHVLHLLYLQPLLYMVFAIKRAIIDCRL